MNGKTLAEKIPARNSFYANLAQEITAEYSAEILAQKAFLETVRKDLLKRRELENLIDRFS